jgi:hypothetical protein
MHKSIITINPIDIFNLTMSREIALAWSNFHAPSRPRKKRISYHNQGHILHQPFDIVHCIKNTYKYSSWSLSSTLHIKEKDNQCYTYSKYEAISLQLLSTYHRPLWKPSLKVLQILLLPRVKLVERTHPSLYSFPLAIRQHFSLHEYILSQSHEDTRRKMSNTHQINNNRQLTPLDVLYFAQTAYIYQVSFPLDTSNCIILVPRAQPLKVNEQLDGP